MGKNENSKEQKWWRLTLPIKPASKFLIWLIFIGSIAGGAYVMLDGDKSRASEGLKIDSIKTLVADFQDRLQYQFYKKFAWEADAKSQTKDLSPSDINDEKKKLNKKIEEIRSEFVVKFKAIPITTNLFKYTLGLILLLSGVTGIFWLLILRSRQEKGERESLEKEKKREWEKEMSIIHDFKKYGCIDEERQKALLKNFYEINKQIESIEEFKNKIKDSKLNDAKKEVTAFERNLEAIKERNSANWKKIDNIPLNLLKEMEGIKKLVCT